MINEGMTRYNSFNWVDHLQEYVYNRNDSKHGVTKKKPKDIWVAGRDKEEFEQDKDIKEIRKKLVDKAKRDVARVEVSKYKKGDYVRASMTSLYSEQRRLEKQGNGKLLPVKFSPEVYIVEQVIKPKKQKDFANEEYILKLIRGDIIKTESKRNDRHDLVREPRRFFATDLQHAERNQKQVLTQHQGVQLNKLGVDALNDEEEEQQESKRETARKRTKVVQAINQEERQMEREFYERFPRRSTRIGRIEVDFD
jgi:hypothetical protein